MTRNPFRPGRPASRPEEASRARYEGNTVARLLAHKREADARALARAKELAALADGLDKRKD